MWPARSFEFEILAVDSNGLERLQPEHIGAKGVHKMTQKLTPGSRRRDFRQIRF